MDNIIDAVLLFIQDNLDNKISLRKLSEIFDTNYCYLSSEFKKRTGMSFSKYMITKKIELAKKNLEDDNKEIKEISYDLGYQSQTQFYRNFKSIVGMPPKRYQKIYRGLISRKSIDINQNIENKPKLTRKSQKNENKKHFT